MAKPPPDCAVNPETVFQYSFCELIIYLVMNGVEMFFLVNSSGNMK
jgi:hypothetical protein